MGSAVPVVMIVVGLLGFVVLVSLCFVMLFLVVVGLFGLDVLVSLCLVVLVLVVGFLTSDFVVG